MNYRNLNAESIITTIEVLCDRIRERFPDRGIVSVSRELCDIAKDSKRRAARRLSVRRYLQYYTSEANDNERSYLDY